MNISTATLQNGQTIQYLETADPVEGGMKNVYFTPDKCFAIAFFKDSKSSDDPNRLRRLEAVLGKYNPTKQENGKYWETDDVIFKRTVSNELHDFLKTLLIDLKQIYLKMSIQQ